MSEIGICDQKVWEVVKTIEYSDGPVRYEVVTSNISGEVATELAMGYGPNYFARVKNGVEDKASR